MWAGHDRRSGLWPGSCSAAGHAVELSGEFVGVGQAVAVDGDHHAVRVVVVGAAHAWAGVAVAGDLDGAVVVGGDPRVSARKAGSRNEFRRCEGLKSWGHRCGVPSLGLRPI